MSNVASVTFKVQPDYFVALKAMAASQGKSLSELAREAVESALELEVQAKGQTALYARARDELS